MKFVQLRLEILLRRDSLCPWGHRNFEWASRTFEGVHNQDSLILDPPGVIRLRREIGERDFEPGSKKKVLKKDTNYHYK